jgi:hypothetical protein
MEKPAVYRITMYQGATFDQQFVWKIDDVVVNLTTYTARMQVRKDYNSTTAVISLTSTSGITLGSAGQINIFIAPSATAAVPGGTYRYDLELVSGAGKVTRLLEGLFIVSPEVTR